MFDVAPTELLLVVMVALVVIGPKDLPKAMRFVGKWVGKARGMARHFRAGLDTMMREAELEDLEKKWREQNDAIMREFPRVTDATETGESPVAIEPGGTPETDTPMNDGTPDSADKVSEIPETHAIPPKDGPLP